VTKQQAEEIERLRDDVDRLGWANERLESANERLRGELLEAERGQRRSELPDLPFRRDPAADYDALGRKKPAPLNFMHFARAIPGYAALFNGRAPDEFVAQVADGVVEVACVCKPDELPRCKRLVPTPCRCGRWFLYNGSSVLVARLPEPASA
jgi:hypothetical protein